MDDVKKLTGVSVCSQHSKHGEKSRNMLDCKQEEEEENTLQHVWMCKSASLQYDQTSTLDATVTTGQRIKVKEAIVARYHRRIGQTTTTMQNEPQL